VCVRVLSYAHTLYIHVITMHFSSVPYTLCKMRTCVCAREKGAGVCIKIEQVGVRFSEWPCP